MKTNSIPRRLWLLLLLAVSASAYAAPVINSITWPSDAPLQEGRTVLLRVQGSGLAPDLVPAFVVQSTNLGTFSQWTANGTNAGMRFHIPVLPSLGASNNLVGQLVLTAPGGSSASAPVTILGLDEFHLFTGQTLVITNISQRLYSTILIDAGAMIRVEGAGAMDWKSTGPVVIDGVIDAKGWAGTPANGGLGGSVFGRKAGTGGNGGLWAGNFPPQAGSDGDNPLPPLRIAVSGGFGYFEPASAGGLAGHNDGAASTATCMDFNNPPCDAAVNALFDYALLPGNHNFTMLMLAGAQGWSGVGVETNFARPRAGYAGGGGGGGGAGTAVPQFDGGGGGQGGEGGRGVRILTASTLTLNNLVTTDGGRGGDGWKGGTVPLTDTPSLFDLTYSGGGGGGGAPGELILASRGTFQRLAGVTTISAGGGKAGQGGIRLYDASVIHEEPWVERGVERVTPGMQSRFSTLGFQQGPVFSPAVWDDLVTSATIVEVFDTIKTNRSAPPYTLEIRGELPGQVRVVNVSGVTNSILGLFEAPYRATLVLFPGFNTIIARPTDGVEPMDHPDYAMLQRRIFTLGGTDFCDGDCQNLLTNAYAENGIVRYIAGDGINHNFNYQVENVPALTTGLSEDEMRLAYGPDGRLYFTQSSSNNALGHVIRRIDDVGIVTTIAGGGTNTADNIPASEASLKRFLEAMAVGSDGSIYLYERFVSPSTPQIIRKIGPDGLIHTVVGGGTDMFFSSSSVPALSVDLTQYTDYDMALDSADNIYLSRRLMKVTPTTTPPFSRTDVVGVISRVTPDGMLQNLIGGNYVASASAGGGLKDTEWEGQPALAAAVFPKALAVSADGQQIYFHDNNSKRLVRADLNLTGNPGQTLYVLHNVSTNSMGVNQIGDGLPSRLVKFENVWDLSLAPDGSLFVGGQATLPDGHNDAMIRKITPGGLCYLVYGGETGIVAPTNTQPARFRGRYDVNYSDTLVGPDNRLVFSPSVNSLTRIAKIVQPWDVQPPFEPAPTVSFGTPVMVVWETNGSLSLPFHREGYAGAVYLSVIKPVSGYISGSPAADVTLNVEDTEKTVQLFNLNNNFVADGTRTVEFALQFRAGDWTPPLTDPGLEEMIGQPDRLTLIILDDDSPPPPAHLLAPVLLGGQVQISAIGIPNHSYVLQNSFDLLSWADQQTNSSPVGVLDFQINAAIEKEFFRLRDLAF